MPAATRQPGQAGLHVPDNAPELSQQIVLTVLDCVDAHLHASCIDHRRHRPPYRSAVVCAQLSLSSVQTPPTIRWQSVAPRHKMTPCIIYRHCQDSSGSPTARTDPSIPCIGTCRAPPGSIVDASCNVMACLAPALSCRNDKSKAAAALDQPRVLCSGA